MPTKTLGFCQPCLLLVTRFHHFQNVHARNGSFNKYGHYVFSTKMNFSTAATVFMPTRYMYIYQQCICKNMKGKGNDKHLDYFIAWME